MRSARDIIAEVVRGTESEGTKLTLGGDAISAIIQAQAIDRLTDAVLELAHATRPSATSEAIREAMIEKGRADIKAHRELIVPEGVDLSRDSTVEAEVTNVPINQESMPLKGPIKVLGDDDFGNKGDDR